MIFRIVRYLVAIDVVLVAVMFTYAAVIGARLSDTLPFALIILIASVPVALPATFTVAQAVGALELSRGADDRHRGHGVLVTRLSAVQEGASMDVLCTDKTGTLTLNQLTLEDTLAYPPFSAADLLDLAALASDDSGQDPIDLAILRAGGRRARRHPCGVHPVRPLDEADRGDRRRRGGGADPDRQGNARGGRRPERRPAGDAGG